MIQPQLKQLINSSLSVDDKDPGLLHLDFSVGWNAGILKLANDYFPSSKFSFRLAPAVAPGLPKTLEDLKQAVNQSTGDSVTFQSGENSPFVIGENYPFNTLPLTVVFSLKDGEAFLKITAITAAGQKQVLSNYLPLFIGTAANRFSFTSLTFILDSSVEAADDNSPFQIAAKLNIANTLSGFNELLQLDDELNCSGYAWLKKGASEFYGIRLFVDKDQIADSNGNPKELSAPGFKIKLMDFGIVDNILYDFVLDSNFSYPFIGVNAELTISDTIHVPIGIELGNLDLDIHLKADLNGISKFGITALEDLINGDGDKFNFSESSPKGAVPNRSITDNITFTEFGIYFNPALKKISRFYGGVQFNNLDFSIINNLSAGLKGFHFEVTGQGGKKKLVVVVDGEVEIGKDTSKGIIKIELTKSFSGASTAFSIAGWLKEGTAITLSDIVEIFVPDNKVSLPACSIHALDFVFSSDGITTAWSFDMDVKGSVPVPFDNPVFFIRQVDLSMSSQGGAYQFAIGGVLAIGKVEIGLTASYGTENGWIFKGQTGPNQLIYAGELIDDLWQMLQPDASVNKLPDSIASLAIENVKVNLTSNKALAFEVGLDISNTHVVGDDGSFTSSTSKWKPEALSESFFEFENLQLLIKRSDKISFSAVADFKVGQFVFNAKAVFSDGWSFEASLDKVNTKEILSIEKLANAFGFTNPSLPDFISNLAIKDVAVSFQSVLLPGGTKPKNADKHFLISLTDETTAVSVEIDLKIDVTYNSEGENIDFSGHLTATDKKGNADPVSNEKPAYVFDVIKQNSEKSKLLLASYHKENGTDVNLKIITDALGISGGPAISIGLKDALFFNDVDSSGTNMPFDLFMADVGAGMNLSGLPLIGKVLPQDATVSLALRIVYASAAYAWGLADVNKLLPDGITKITTPDKSNDKRSFSLISEIKIGDQAFQLNVPVQFDSNKAPKQIQESTAPPVNNNLPAAPSPNGDITWITIGKKFGPVIFNRLGINYKDSLINVYPDAALEMNGLTFTLDGLSVSSPLTEFKPSFHLKGLGLDYNNGTIEIGASFLRRTIQIDGEEVDEFDGMAIIKTAKLSLSALGSYAYYKGSPSLFIYAYLNQALGGPGFFFVEGLAAAIGYNRSLIMPSIDQVSSFPLVRQVMETQQPDPNISRADLLTQQLDAIAKYVPVSPGQMFFAIGIKFNSFKLIDSFVLLAISFGRHLEVDVLGQSNIIVPSMLPQNGPPPLAQIKIQLMAKYLPDEGFLSVMAQVTKDSYIFSPNCHLTGGAAFYSWFKGEHEGDFVMTIGGYHPSFKVPAHYPQVPRVGFSWQVDSTISIKGDMYFALCAHAFMAGGHLEALFENGPLKAWFRAGADFLLTWQPYHYDARMYLDIGASYTYHLFGTHHLSIDLGADVHLWGPDLAGEATLHIWIFDVDVSFGNPGTASPQPISFGEFKTKCLPDEKKIISAAIIQGQHGEDENRIPVVNAKELAVGINSAIPIYSFTGIQFKDLFIPVAFNIAPMGAAAVNKSEMAITVLRNGNELTEELKNLVFTPVKKKVPAALWGSQFLQDINTDEKTIELVTGVTITTREPGETGATDFVELEKLLENDSIDLTNVFSGTKVLNKTSELQYDSKIPDSLCKLLGVSTIPVYS